MDSSRHVCLLDEESLRDRIVALVIVGRVHDDGKVGLLSREDARFDPAIDRPLGEHPTLRARRLQLSVESLREARVRRLVRKRERDLLAFQVVRQRLPFGHVPVRMGL